MAFPPTLFVYAPALYPHTPLINRTAFVHGKLVEVKIKPNEVILKGKDEKGEWSAYVEQYAERYEVGQSIRAYGLIAPQPDGSVSLAAKWAKTIQENEYRECERATKDAWPAIQGQNPSIEELKPFISTPSKVLYPPVNATISAPKPPASEDPDFVSASQFKVEREYL
jgi:hypothetical protein